MRSLAFCGGLPLLLAAVSAQELMVPAGMAFRAATETTSNSTTTVIMRNSGYHSQLLYEASHFTGQGIGGPIVIDRLRFRVEDGEPNAGGHTWSNVTVRLSDAPLGMTAASMSTTFANNIGANVGTPVVVNVTSAPAAGTVPNDYVIDIPLGTGAFTYDPTTMGALVVEFTSPSAPSPSTGTPPLACTSTVATHLARALQTTSQTALTGGLVAAVPVCRFGFQGAGGAPVVPARTESVGVACGGAGASFYQLFGPGEPFDLQNRSLLLTPDQVAAPGGYTVTAGNAAPDLVRIGTRISTTDDALVTVALPITFAFPGGSTSTIKVCTNGFVWLSSTPTTTDPTPSALDLLGNNSSNYPARLAPLWFNLHPGRNVSTHPQSGLYSNIDTSGGLGNVVVYLTWRETGVNNSVSAGGHCLDTFQVVLHESTMQVEFRYGSIQSAQGGGALVGFSRGSQGGGQNASNPGSRDLSAQVPFTVAGPEGAPGFTLAASTPVVPGSNRAIHGTLVSLTASSIPVGDDIGFWLYDFAALQPSLPHPFLRPGCLQSVLQPTLWAIGFGWTPGGSTTCPVPFQVPNGFAGATICFQLVTWNLVAGPLGAHTTNGVLLRLGQQ